MEDFKLINTLFGDCLLISKYSNKIYKINDRELENELKELEIYNTNELVKRLQAIGIDCPRKKELQTQEFFQEIELIITYNCNLACEYCWQRRANMDKEISMSKETFMNIVNYMKRNNQLFRGTYKIGYMGGEPLIEFDFIRWSYQYMKENLSKELELRILTNGTNITQEMCEFFRENKINIIVSLDGPKAVNKKRGNFEKIMKGIELLQKNQISMSIQSTLDIDSYINGFGLETVKFFLNSKIIDFNLMFEGPIPVFDSEALYCTNVEIITYAIEWAKRNHSIPFILKEFILSIILPDSKISQCFCKFLYPKGFQVGPNGEMFACEFDREKISYGNVNSDKQNPLIRSNPFIFKTSKYNQRICDECDYVGFCNGYPMLCSLYTGAKDCPKKQYFKASFDYVYPVLKDLILIMKEE